VRSTHLFVLPALVLSLGLPASAVPLVVIDPGHGGSQDGAASQDGLLEKNLALALAKKLKAALEKEVGATAKLTRDKDQLVHLSDRVAWANQQKPDLFISLHANSMPTQRQRNLIEGVETYFLSAHASHEDARKVAARENAEVPGAKKAKNNDTLAFILADLQRSEAHADSSRLAYLVHEQLIGATSAVDRGVQQAPFYVLMGIDAPAILVEVGFISHPNEGERLADEAYQDMLAKAVALGVKNFFKAVEKRDGRPAR
jgi:N-acetylmuramoyl-L-alanine amidase